MLDPSFLTTNKYKMIVDYHVHSDYNDDATGTVEECVQSALKKGLSSIAITNHVWKTSTWVDDFIDEVKVLRSRYRCHALTGLEAKIININGEVDLLPCYIKEVELVLGALHHLPTRDDYVWLDKESLPALKAAEIIRDATLNLIARNTVNVVAHPLAFYYSKYSQPFPVDFLEEIVRSASKRGVALEIYNSKHPLPEEVFAKLISLCVDCEALMTIGSDAHNPSEIGKIDYQKIQSAIKLALRGVESD